MLPIWLAGIFKEVCENSRIKTRINFLKDIHTAIDHGHTDMACFGMREFISVYGAQEDIVMDIDSILSHFESGPAGRKDSIGKLRRSWERAQPRSYDDVHFQMRYYSLAITRGMSAEQQSVMSVGLGLIQMIKTHKPDEPCLSYMIKAVRGGLELMRERDALAASDAARKIIASAVPRYFGEMGILMKDYREDEYLALQDANFLPLKVVAASFRMR